MYELGKQVDIDKAIDAACVTPMNPQLHCIPHV